jgi:hypothetical protein
MIPMLRNVLTFLKCAVIPISKFETTLNLPQGTMQKFLEEKKELTPEIMSKIAASYSKEIQEQGYYTIDMSPFGSRGLGLIYSGRDEDNPFEENTDDYANWLIDHRIKQRVVEKDTWLKIEVIGIELPPAIMKFDYHAILDILPEKEYEQENTSSTDLLVFRVRNNFKEKAKTTIYIDPTDGHNECVIWTVG